MRDHRFDMTPAEREQQQRSSTDITALVGLHGPRIQTTKQRKSKRAKRKQTARSRRRNRP